MNGPSNSWYGPVMDPVITKTPFVIDKLKINKLPDEILKQL